MNPEHLRQLNQYSAYQGGSWNQRTFSHDQEMGLSHHWSSCGVNTEYSVLNSVMLYRPPQRPPFIPEPERIQHLGPINWPYLHHELEVLTATFKSHQIEVVELNSDSFPHSPPNLMFVRDHFLMTPWGAVLGRMASQVRAGEEKWSQLALAQAGVPILQMIRGSGTFEGADALWLSPRLVLVGIGHRTNQSGFSQLRQILQEMGVMTLSVSLPPLVQHLLGMLQIVDAHLALVRTQLHCPSLAPMLKELGFEIIEVTETMEVTHRQGMNIVTLGNRELLMPAHCPQLKSHFTRHHLNVVAEIPFVQHLQAAGGLACATGILSRHMSNADD